MFDALLHGRIDTKGVRFELNMCDIEQLNAIALNETTDICKLSYAVYPLVSDRYQILSAGSALGRGNGPLVVSRRKIWPDELKDAVVGIPGAHTTANLLLKIAFPEIVNKKEYLFSDISTAINDGEIDAGVLIHEERFSYRDKGLQLVADLGACWEQLTSLPIPLGAIVINRSLESQTKELLNGLIAESIRFGFRHPELSYPFVKSHARELSDQTIENHIRMFVNEFSVDIGQEGKQAVKALFDKSGEHISQDSIFI